MFKRVYLAGPITGLDYKGASAWRQEVRARLNRVGIEAYSPMRDKERLKEVGEINGTTIGYGEFGAFYNSKGIVARDKYDCTRSDMVLMNLLGARSVSIGTMVEMGFAAVAGVPVVLVMEPGGNPHEHVFVRELASFVVESVEEAVKVVEGVLLP